MTDPTVISVHGVRKRFVLHAQKSLKERVLNLAQVKQHRRDFWALDDIDLEIGMGSTVGLVGHNGSGKSTLLKVIGGIIEPTEGTVKRRGRLAALLELGAGFHQDLTGRENVYLNAAILGLSRQETERQFDAIIDFAGVEDFIDTQVKFYSSGMYLRLAFAVAVHTEPDILLVDEVLAVGDEPFQKKCFDKIREFQREGGTIVLVSHSATDIGRLCDRVVVLDHGKQIFDGEPSEGLRVLRYGYEHGGRLDAQKAPDAVAASEEPRSRIASIAIESPDGRPDLEPGRPAQVTFRYTLAESHPGIHAVVSFETSKGHPVFSVSTRALGLALPSAPGEHALRVDLPALHLGGGNYAVSGILEDDSARALDRVGTGASFHVSPPPAGSGLVSMPVSLSVLG